MAFLKEIPDLKGRKKRRLETKHLLLVRAAHCGIVMEDACDTDMDLSTQGN